MYILRERVPLSYMYIYYIYNLLYLIYIYYYLYVYIYSICIHIYSVHLTPLSPKERGTTHIVRSFERNHRGTGAKAPDHIPRNTLIESAWGICPPD